MNKQEKLSIQLKATRDKVADMEARLKAMEISRKRLQQKASAAIQNEEAIEYSAKKNLKISDLTGAGDLFAAGFLHGYVNKLSLKESLEKGTELSSKIIQKIGARI